MSAIYLDSVCDDRFRRHRLYAGDLFVYSPTPATIRICELARNLIEKSFPDLDPLRVHESLPARECLSALSHISQQFINETDARDYVPAILQDLGCDAAKTYFDLPGMQFALPSEQRNLAEGNGLVPHRDTWHAAPFCQINWWIPIYDMVAENCMLFLPRYWNRAVRNGSHRQKPVPSYPSWAGGSAGGRAAEEPLAEEELELEPDIRLVCEVGQVIVFSAAHLYSAGSNASDVTQYSVEIRTVHVDDVNNRRGAPNLDSSPAGTRMPEYVRASDFSKLPAETIALYETETGLSYPDYDSAGKKRA